MWVTFLSFLNSENCSRTYDGSLTKKILDVFIKTANHWYRKFYLFCFTTSVLGLMTQLVPDHCVASPNVITWKHIFPYNVVKEGLFPELSTDNAVLKQTTQIFLLNQLQMSTKTALSLSVMV